MNNTAVKITKPNYTEGILTVIPNLLGYLARVQSNEGTNLQYQLPQIVIVGGSGMGKTSLANFIQSAIIFLEAKCKRNQTGLIDDVLNARYQDKIHIIEMQTELFLQMQPDVVLDKRLWFIHLPFLKTYQDVFIKPLFDKVVDPHFLLNALSQYHIDNDNFDYKKQNFTYQWVGDFIPNIHHYLKVLFGDQYRFVIEICARLINGQKIEKPILIHGLTMDNDVHNIGALLMMIMENDSLLKQMYHDKYIDKSAILESRLYLNKEYKAALHLMRAQELDVPTFNWLQEEPVIVIKAQTPKVKTEWKDLENEVFLFINEQKR